METHKVTSKDKVDRKRKRRSGHVSKTAKMSARMESYPEMETTETGAQFDEYYVNDNYCIDKKNNEFYARLHTGEESYLTVEGQPVYAFKLTDKNTKAAVLALDGNGQQKYAFDSENNPIFPKIDDRCVYAVNKSNDEIYPVHPETGDEIYMTDTDENEIMAKDTKDKPKYAVQTFDGMQLEIPPKNKDGNSQLCPLSDGKVLIPFNLTTSRPLYPKNENNDEVYYKDDKNNEYYAVDKEGNEWYAMDSKGNEKFAKLANGQSFYRKNFRNDEKYPISKEKHEVYRSDGTREYYAGMANGEGYYAKLNDTSEYYPKTYIFEDYEVKFEKGEEDEVEIDYEEIDK